MRRTLHPRHGKLPCAAIQNSFPGRAAAICYLSSTILRTNEKVARIHLGEIDASSQTEASNPRR